MQNVPLSVPALLDHAAICHGDTEIVSRLPEGGIRRYDYRELRRRSLRMARTLERLGIKRAERIGTLAWNTSRHLEIYYGVSGYGAVCHTINPRLFADQVAYIIAHADDRCVYFDASCLSLVETVRPLCPRVAAWIVLAGTEALSPDRPWLLSYESLLAEADEGFAWPQVDENSPAGLCYTSGTTGRPKGVAYTHRSIVLHAYAVSLPDAFGLSAHDVVLPIVPMFHVNAWGLPYAAPLTGAKMVLPGAALDAKSLIELCRAEGVTFSCGVPTVWRGVAEYLRTNQERLPLPHRAIIGGAAPPVALIAALEEEHGIEVRQGWGMTEISPVGVVNRSKRPATDSERRNLRSKQGRPLPGIEVRIVDDAGMTLPWNGAAFGGLQVRGPWVCAEYFESTEESDSFHPEGWFATGDMATINGDGFVQIVDRVKDMVKSGGEWISSMELENLAAAHPEVREAAVIAVPDEKWGERPLLIVVRNAGSMVAASDILAFLRPQVAKWWLPERVDFIEQLPRTATGKVLKNQLKSEYIGSSLHTQTILQASSKVSRGPRG